MKTLGKKEAGGDSVGTQHAALCFRTDARGATEILLITSRDTGRWVIPKGWPVPRLDAAASAAQEAWEEAGVKGRVHDTCLGLYSYGKVLDGDTVLPTVVTVHPVEVDKLAKSYPERGARRRKWFSPAKAATKVDEPELADLIARFDPAPFRQG